MNRRLASAFVTLAACLDASATPQDDLAFVENRGQWDTPATFIARRGPLLARLENHALVVQLSDAQRGQVLRIEFEGASDRVKLVGEEPLVGVHHYLRGADPERWVRSARRYTRVVYRGLYEGIDLVLRDREGRLEYDLVLAPGADLAAFRAARLATCAAAISSIDKTTSGAVLPNCFSYNDSMNSLSGNFQG